MKGVKMKKVHSYLFLPLLMILLLGTPVIGSADWVEYGRSANGNVYSYHTGTMKQKTKDIVQVWVKLVFSAEGRQEYFNRLKNMGESTEGYDKLSHSLSLVEIDWKKARLRILYGSEYDEGDRELFRGSRDAPWKDILPSSTEEILREKVCR
jgi:hypothetical protein